MKLFRHFGNLRAGRNLSVTFYLYTYPGVGPYARKGDCPDAYFGEVWEHVTFGGLSLARVYEQPVYTRDIDRLNRAQTPGSLTGPASSPSVHNRDNTRVRAFLLCPAMSSVSIFSFSPKPVKRRKR